MIKPLKNLHYFILNVRLYRICHSTLFTDKNKLIRIYSVPDSKIINHPYFRKIINYTNTDNLLYNSYNNTKRSKNSTPQEKHSRIDSISLSDYFRSRNQQTRFASFCR